jgi:molecular chaperone GrpE (heat shock protein)
MGEPLGDSATYRKADGGMVLGGGGGGGGSSTGTQTQINELPEWARPYAKSTLEKTAALSEKPYQRYDQPRFAGFSPLQQQAQEQAAGMQTSGLTGLGGQVAGQAALRGLGQNYQGGQFYGGQFGGQEAAQYMSPFIQQALAPQLREAQRASDIMGQQNAARAVGQGAFGGSRSALVEAERQRNLGIQQGDIMSKGLQDAYTQAANQFNADQQRAMQAQQLGEQSRQFGANIGMQGLQTALTGAGQLGALGSQQFQQGMDINKLQAAYGAQQQALRQQGLTQAYQDFMDEQNYPYKQLGFMSDMIRGLPLGQQSTTQMYQAPGSLLGQAAGLGVGALGLSSLYNAANKAKGGEIKTYAGDRGSVTSSDFIEDKLDSIRGNTEALFRAKQAALARRDFETAAYVDQLLASNDEMRAQNASINSGLGYAFDQLPAESQDNMIRAASGGMVAFAEGGDEGKPMSYGEQMRSLGSFLADIPKHIVSYPGYGFSRPSKPEAKSEPAAVADKFDRATATRREDYMGTLSEDTGAGKSKPKADGHPSVAEARGIAEAMGQGDTFEDNYNKFLDKLTSSSKDQLKSIKDTLLANAKDSEEIKKAGLGKALAAFGFNMAANAARPGQARRPGLGGLLESAAAASPTLYESAAETDRLARAAKDNAMKMNLEMTKYEVALKKGDQQTAANLANSLETRKLQQAQLNEQIRSNKVKEGILSARAGATGNRMDLEVFKATGRAQEKAATHALNIFDKVYGGRVPKELKDKGMTQEQFLRHLEKQNVGRFLPGALSESKSKDTDDVDVDLFS